MEGGSEMSNKKDIYVEQKLEPKPYPKELQKKLYMLALEVSARLQKERSST